MIQRVNGSLAVSRALGDYEYKNVEGKGPCEQLVSPEPEVFIEERTPQDEFMVLACDGIWDVMTNDELCAFIANRMKITSSLEEVCNQVVDTCLIKVIFFCFVFSCYTGLNSIRMAIYFKRVRSLCMRLVFTSLPHGRDAPFSMDILLLHLCPSKGP